MSKPQAPIAVQMLKEWRIRRPYVYRYLEKEFVDLFFKEGILRLSSFSKFSKHGDEERLDAQEGRGIIENFDHTGQGQSMFAAIGQGHDAYVLCGALKHSQDLSQAFSADSGFRINDTTSFGCAIANAILGFRGGLEGSCVYAEKRVVVRSSGQIDLDSMRISPDRKELDMGKMFAAISNVAGDDLFFLKLKAYEHQCEYRLIWVVSSPNEHIDVVCPEAREFCTRFEDIA
ncbi:MAG: hypothetical protein J0L89_05755 [Xanthomonadales bacterium]|nr:hypothetical protein [Xanthomonadales bacterium]